MVFEADTAAGKAFDVVLLLAIGLSVLVVMLDSVESIAARHHDALLAAEWAFTLLFSVEYLLRLVCARRPLGYARSFYGIIDLLAVLPTYLTLMHFGWQHGVVLRLLRLLRIFRVFKLAHFLGEADALRRALAASRAKIIVFLSTVVIIACIMGAAMHLIEGPASGFTSIPQSLYWAVVTLTTVGYGDLSPVTPLGKVVAGLMMILGYSILVIPGGLISVEWARATGKVPTTQVCPDCSREGHDTDARHCKHCGAAL